MTIDNKQKSKNSYSRFQKLFDWFSTESTERSFVDQLIICSHYSTDYLIMLFILWQIYCPLTLNEPLFCMVAIFARIGTGIAYILSKKVGFLVMNKCSLLANLILIDGIDSPLAQLPVFLFQILIGLGWSLTKEQRISHFDSRLDLRYPMLKQTFLLSFIFIFEELNYFTNQRTQMLMTVGTLLIIISMIDFEDNLYFTRTKHIFLVGDSILFILLILMQISSQSSQQNIQYYFLVMLIVLVMMGSVFLFNSDFIRPKLMFKLSINSFFKYSDQEIIQYFLEIRNILHLTNMQYIYIFIEKAIEECSDLKMLQDVIRSKKGTIQDKKQALEFFLFRLLRSLALKSERIATFFIFYYSPDTKIYQVVNLQNWQHQRQYQRIMKTKQIDNAIKIMQAQQQMDEIKLLIIKYISESRQYFQKLMRERISGDYIIEKGIMLSEILRQIENKKKYSYKFTQDIRNLLNNFTIKVNNRKSLIIQNQIDPPYLLQKTAENPPCMIISAQEDQFCQIIESNLNFTKLTYFRKQQLKGVNLAVLLPEEIKQRHTALMIKKSRGKNFSGKTDFPADLYIKNKLGYIITGTAEIYPLNQLQGRTWCVILYPSYLTRSIMVVTAMRLFEGGNELSRYHGLTPDIGKQRIRLQLWDNLLQHNEVIIEPNEVIFQASQFVFSKFKLLKVQKCNEYKAMNHTYYFIEIFDYTDKLKSKKQRINQFQNNDSKLALITVPINSSKMQFHFHWNCKISTNVYSQKILLSSRKLRDPSKQWQKYQNHQDIGVMRLFQNKIDFVQNYDEQKQFKGLPERNQIRDQQFLITQEQYHKIIEQSNQTIQTWTIIVRITLLLLFLSSLTSTFLLYALNRESITDNNLKVSAIFLLGNKYSVSIEMGCLIILPRLNKGWNYTEMISQKVLLQTELSNQLYVLDQSLFQNDLGKSISNQLNTLSLMINQYLINMTYPHTYVDILNYITEIDQGFKNLIASYQSFFIQSNNGYRNKQIVVLIVFGIFLLCFLFVLIKIQKYLLNKQNQVIQIWKDVENETIMKEQLKIVQFQEEYLFNEDIKQEEDSFLDLENYNNIHEMSKRIIPPQRSYTFIMIYCFWSVIIISSLYFSCFTNDYFLKLGETYTNYTNQLQLQQTSYFQIWNGFNNYPVNITKIQQSIKFSYATQYQRTSILKDMYDQLMLGKEFNTIHNKYWFTRAVCTEFKQAECNNTLNEIDIGGGSMIIGTLNVLFDSILTAKFTSPSTILTLPNINDISNIVYNFLDSMDDVSVQELQKEYSRQQNQYQNFINLLLGWNIICCCGGLLFYLHFNKWRMKLRQLEQILMILPFDSLKKINGFKTYLKNNI